LPKTQMMICWATFLLTFASTAAANFIDKSNTFNQIIDYHKILGPIKNKIYL
jgi:hypothetical protein